MEGWFSEELLSNTLLSRVQLFTKNEREKNQTKMHMTTHFLRSNYITHKTIIPIQILAQTIELL